MSLGNDKARSAGNMLFRLLPAAYQRPWRPGVGNRNPMSALTRSMPKLAVTRAEEITFLAERMGAWLSDGIESHAIGAAARYLQGD
jgi:hypothetical protein